MADEKTWPDYPVTDLSYAVALANELKRAHNDAFNQHQAEQLARWVEACEAQEPY